MNDLERAWATYEAAVDSALKTYKATRDAARAVCEATINSAWETYIKAKAGRCSPSKDIMTTAAEGA